MKKALIIYGGWEGHEPRPVSEFFAQELTQAGLQVELVDSLEVLQDVDRLRQFALITPNWTMGALTKEQEKGLTAAIAAGVGLGGFHGGQGDAFRASTAYQFMVGGQFVAHPDDHKDYSVEIVASNDPITKDLTCFTLHSEQYYMHVDPSNEILAFTTFQTQSAPWVNGCIMPVAWKRSYGAGRVFYCSLGHNTKVFSNPQALALTLRGMLWAAHHDL